MAAVKRRLDRRHARLQESLGVESRWAPEGPARQQPEGVPQGNGRIRHLPEMITLAMEQVNGGGVGKVPGVEAEAVWQGGGQSVARGAPRAPAHPQE